jgi:hypothetical protein
VLRSQKLGKSLFVVCSMVCRKQKQFTYLIAHGTKRIRKGLPKRLKPLNKVYTLAAYLEKMFTHEVRKYGNKFAPLQKKIYIHEARKHENKFTQFIKNGQKKLL